MVTLIVTVIQVVLSIFGISWSKDGVSWNWRRMLLWALVLPHVALIGSIIYSVGSSILGAFQAFSGSGGIPSIGTRLENLILLPSVEGLSIARYWSIIRFIFMFLGLDILLSTGISWLLISLMQSNVGRVASYAAGLVKVTIKFVEGK